jgi:hypothetical protein
VLLIDERFNATQALWLFAICESRWRCVFRNVLAQLKVFVIVEYSSGRKEAAFLTDLSGFVLWLCSFGVPFYASKVQKPLRSWVKDQ